MRSCTNSKLFAVACVSIGILFAPCSGAAPMIWGNSFIRDSGGFLGGDEIGWAVYNRDGGTVSDPWQLGIDLVFPFTFFPAGLDTTATYLYLYQIINSTNGPAINQANIPAVHDVTSYGAFAAFGAPHFNLLNGLTFYDGKPPPLSGLIVTSPPLIEHIVFNDLPVPFYFPTVSLTGTELTAATDISCCDSASFIFGYTSNKAPLLSDAITVNYPAFTNGGILYSGTAFLTGVPTVPEPSTFFLISLGLVGIALGKYRSFALLKQNRQLS